MSRITNKKSTREIDMIHGPLARKIIQFAMPLAVSSMLQQMFNAADLAVVGRFASSRAMAAVGSNSSVINLLIGLFVGLSVGATVVIANQIGAGRRSGISEALHTVIALALVLGCFLAIFGVVVAPQILKLMGAPEEVLSLATIYLRIYFLGMPAILVYNYGSAVLRSRGDSNRPFYALTLAGVVNIVLNLIFVAIFHLHVIGVALATVLSNLLSSGLILHFLMTEEDEAFRLDLKKLRIKKEYLTSVIRIGLPAGLQGTVFSLSNVVIQSAVNSFGADCIAGMTAGANFDYISYSLMSGFTQAAVTFTSQNYGAGDAGRCRKVYRLCMGLGIGIDLLCVAAMYLSRGTLIRIFTTDEAVISYAMIRIRYAFLFHSLVGTYEISAGALRGINRGLVPALISVIGTCGFRMLYLFAIFPMYRSPAALMMVYPFSWILTGIAMNTAYFIARGRAFAHMAKAAG